jgi:hypothetical protein
MMAASGHGRAMVVWQRLGALPRLCLSEKKKGSGSGLE